MFIKSSIITFSTLLLINDIFSLTLPNEFLKSNEFDQLSLKEEDQSNLLSKENNNLQENLNQAAIHARELIQYRSQGLGTLISNFPEDHSDNSLKGLPIGLQEYFAPYPNGDLLLLSLPISNIYHNIQIDPNHSVTFSIKDELGLIQRQSSLWSANWRRISLFGQLEPVSDLQEAKTLYESFHPDSTLWNDNQNPHSPHTSSWSKLRVEKVFYFGGFGDRSSIGWLDLETYRNEFNDTLESETKSKCFHPTGQNLYCDQPNLGSGEVKEVMEESLEGLEDDDEDFDLSEQEEEEEEEDEDEELQELIELWEELDEPQITQVINNNYNNNHITHHHHHHHYRRPVSSSIESQVSSSSNQILEAIENAVIEIREELIEMADEMMEENQVGEEEEEEEEEENELDENEIFRSDQEEEEEEEAKGEVGGEEVGGEEENEVVNEVVNELLEKAFKTMELSEILEEMLDLTEVKEDHQLDSSSSKEEEEEVERVQFEVEI